MKPSFNAMGALRLNPDNVLNKGLVAWYLMNEGVVSYLRDLVSGNMIPLTVGAATPSIGRDSKDGLCLTFPVNHTSRYTTLLPQISSLPLSNFGVVVRYRTTISQVSNCLCGWHGTDDLLLYGADASSTNSGASRMFWRDVGGSINETTGVDLVDGALHTMTLTSTADANHFWCVDDRLVGQWTTSRATAGPFSGFSIGAWVDTSSQDWAGNISSVALYNIGLSVKIASMGHVFPYGTPSNPRFLYLGAKSYFYPSVATPSFKPYWIPKRSRIIGGGLGVS